MPKPEINRRLAAIFAADVVGYSRLMNTDETGTLERLKRLYRELIQPEVLSARGRVVKLMGDGLLVEFPSVVDAVQCAVTIQNALPGRDTELSDDQRIMLRIGINLGDIIVEKQDIYGEGVNIAARLEGLASPGGICVSDSVKTAIGNKLDVKFVSRGSQQVKNIPEPICVYEIQSGQETAQADVKYQDEPLPAIAVLPFDNMSGEPEQEYFSDGISEEIIAALSHFKSFPVIARNSTFTYKGKAVKVQQVASELGARYVLEGSVRKAGERVRVTAQLIDAETGHHVWADRFDRTLTDIFELQDDITRRIVATIQPKLAQAELKKTEIKRTENLNAWDLFLRGMALVNRHTSEDHKPARKLFRDAIELDPAYSDAWSGLAWSYLVNITLIGVDERKAFIDKGLEAAKTAVKLDEHSAFAHYVLGVAYVWNEQIEKSIEEAKLSLRLNPYSAHVRMGLGNRLDLSGRTSEGIQMMKDGLKLSPLDPFCPIIMAYIARALLSQNQIEEALDWMKQSIRSRPDNPDLQYRYAICLASTDQVEKAKKALAECERLKPGFSRQRANWAPYADQDRNNRYFSGMIRHGLLTLGDDQD